MKTLLRETAVVVLFGAVSLVATYPLLVLVLYPSPFHVNDSFLDTLVFHWDLWWMNRAVVDIGTNPFTADLLYYPQGTNLFFTPFVPFFGVLSIPLQAAVPGRIGAIWAYHGLALLTFVASGYFMYRLLRYLGVGGVIAFLAALPFAFSPFRFMHLARLDFLSSFWLPLYALLLVRYLDRGGWRPLLGTGVVGTLTLFSDHHHFLFLFFIAAGWVAYRAVRPTTPRKRLAIRVARCGALQILLLAPLLMLVVDADVAHENLDMQAKLRFEASPSGRPTGEHILLAPDFRNLAYILFPQVCRTLGADRLASTDAPGGDAAGRLRPEKEALPYPALYADIYPTGTAPRGPLTPTFLLSLLFAVALAAGLLRGRGPGKWVWVGLALAALLVALGPTRLVFGTPVPMPFRLLAWVIPPLRVSRYPALFVLLAVFAATPVIAFGIQVLARRKWAAITTFALATVLLIATGRECIEPRSLIRVTETRLTPAYEHLRRDPVPGAIVELPLGNSFLQSYAMSGQMLHGRPMAEGLVVRAAPRTRRFLERDPFMRLLARPPREGRLPDPTETLRNRGRFVAAGFRYILVHAKHYGRAHAPGDLEAVRRVIRAHHPTAEQRFDDVEVFLFEPR